MVAKTSSFLILSTSGGAGHIRAAQALERASRESSLPIRSEHYDCLDLTSKTFKRLYSESYLAIVNKAPELWGYLYTRAEGRPLEKKGILKLFDEVNYKKYLRFLKEKKPDAILCTHFLPYVSVSTTLRKAGIEAPVAAVTTDFDAHQYWVDRVVDRYYVHTDESSWQLRSKGADRNKIVVAGIPVLSQFRRGIDKKSIRRKLGIAEENLTILMAWGGFGVGNAKRMVKEVNAILQTFPDRAFTLVLVCGKNDTLKRQMDSDNHPKNVHRHTFGFVDNMHEFMSAADLLISKAGGLTSAEAMSIGVPMLIVDPIPGQETRNAEIIVEHGAGWKALDDANLGYKLKRIVEQPALLESARTATRGLAKPNAADDILRDVFEMLTKG